MSVILPVAARSLEKLHNTRSDSKHALLGHCMHVLNLLTWVLDKTLLVL